MKSIEEQMYAELAEVKRQRDAYYDELLSKRQRIAELEAKLAQTEEKACAWLMNEFEGGNYVQDWQLEGFRKAMLNE